jgi:hypothetical protein
MNGGIFLIQNSGELVEMTEQPYDTEDVLQQLLARYPNLLAGDQVDPSKPSRWQLVSREMGVPDEEDGANRWSLDHLFLDQDAVPTLIEVKRSSDTRIRREFVGQMLDYAANAVVYWPVEAIRARFEESCRKRGVDPTKEVETLAGSGTSVEDFWQRVKTNLQAGRVRMVFVADVIPPELRRVVEFLNGQMDPAEVLAVEIKQFVGQGLKTLVPRVIGQTVEAERKKGGSGGAEKQWDEGSFFEDLKQRRGDKEAEAARTILVWAKRSVPRIWWGKGSKDGSFYPMLDYKGESHWVVSVWTYGRAEIPFQWMVPRKPFGDEAKRLELWDRLNKIPGVEIPADAISRRPTIRLAVLTDDVALKAFLGVLDWYIAEVKAA